VKPLVKSLLAGLLCLALLGCGSLPELMHDGADRFAQGKPREDYAFSDSGALLNELIDRYSGSYRLPTGAQLDDESYDSALEKLDPETEKNGIPQVGSWDDLLAVFHKVYRETGDYLAIDLVDGYTVDFSQALQQVYNTLQREDPIYVCCVAQWSYGSRGNRYVFDLDYTIEETELRRMKDQTEALVDAAVAGLDTAGKSDYALVCAVNEYLCEAAYYPEEPYAPETHTAYGTLANGVAVCEGYACAAKLLLNKLGILCDIQVGVCHDGGGHAWNLVQLDGQWYQMDVTWNDGGRSRTEYLLVSDAFMAKSRSWDASQYPACPEAYIPQ